MSHDATLILIGGLAVLGILAGLVWCMEREAAEQQRERARRRAAGRGYER